MYQAHRYKGNGKSQLSSDWLPRVEYGVTWQTWRRYQYPDGHVEGTMWKAWSHDDWSESPHSSTWSKFSHWEIPYDGTEGGNTDYSHGEL